MVRWGLRIAALAVLLVGVGWYALDLSSGSEQNPEPTRITSYDARFDVGADGDMQVLEQITVDVPVSDRHGIFRFFDIRDNQAPSARRIPHDIEVTRDGAPEPFTMTSEDNGRYRVAKIGSADTTLSPGSHDYTISYRIDDVLLDGPTAGTSRFYWNLVPGGWQQPIAKARLTVALPGPAERVLCAVGTGAAAGTGCTVAGEGTRTLRVRAESLPPRTPVTVSTVVPVSAPPLADPVPWSQRFDPVLGQSVPALVVVLLLAGVAGLGGYLVSRRTREKTPPFPLQYAPPEGIGPAQGHYLLTEGSDTRTYVASLMQAAEKGAITLDRTANGWSITDAKGPQGWAGLDSVTTSVAGLLSGPGTTFVAEPKDVEAGKRLKSEIASMKSDTATWAREQGYMTSAGIGCLSVLGLFGGAILAGIICITNPASMSTLALVPGLFAIGAVELLSPGASTKRTATGRELWSRIGGFRRILATPSSEQRFEFSGRQELYTAYLPWAVALGCAKEWAQKYRTEMGDEPPIPTYFPVAYLGGGYVDSMVDDFSSTVSSAISSYEATQAPSGGGGGGFSGGGGGGGGGGGSW